MPNLGDFFVTRTAGIPARIIRWGTYGPKDKNIKPKINHAGIYVGDGKVVEATPGGAILSPVDAYLNEDLNVWSDGKFLSPTNTDLQRIGIADLAKQKIGIPYGWGDICALILSQDKGPNIINEFTPYDKQPWWVKRLARQDRLVCSQLVDLVYIEAGITLFDDGRYFGGVAPADLQRILL